MFTIKKPYLLCLIYHITYYHIIIASKKLIALIQNSQKLLQLIINANKITLI